MKYVTLYLFVFASYFFATKAYSQYYFRIESDISIKTKINDESSNLTIGKAYYNRPHEKLVYSIRFPENEIWLIEDSLMYTIVDNNLIRKQSIIPLLQYTIFNLVLEGKLSDFGLEKSQYKISKVETDKDLIITTWTSPSHLKKQYGHIVTSTKNKDLYGVVIFDPSGNILSKQLFKKYKQIEGIRFPEEIIQVVYSDGKESYQLITFKNVQINNLQNESFYNYCLPVAK